MRARIGVFGIGLAAYWPQFPGMRERLTGYQRELEDGVRGLEADVISAGLVDTPEAARAAAQLFQRENVDLIFCYVATYATSSQVLPVVQRSAAPVVVLNLQPSAALDYETADTAEWLANCSVCCVPEIANAFTRARIDFHVVSGQLRGDAAAWREIEDWCRAASVARAVRESRIGFLGHTYPGMLDLYADFTAVHAQLGAHVEVLEMEDLAKRVDSATAERTAKLFTMRKTCAIDRRGGGAGMVRAGGRGARPAGGGFPLTGLTYYYRGLDGNEFERSARA